MFLPSRNYGFILSIFDEDGHIVATSPGHVKFLNRNYDDIVRHSWHEWSLSKEIPDLQNYFNRALSIKEPISYPRNIVRPDGTIVASRSTLYTLKSTHGQSLILGCSNPVSVFENLSTADSNASDVADYTSDLLEQLAKVCSQAGMPSLGEALGDLATQAAQIHALFNRSEILKHDN